MFGYKKVLAISKDEYDEFLKDYDDCATNWDAYRFNKIISDYDVISVVLKLEIPEDAVVIIPDEPYSLVAKLPIKHRCSKAMPVSVEKAIPAIPVSGFFLDTFVLCSRFDPHFTYEIGKMAIPDAFDTDHRHVCTNGIHFFETVEAAIDY